MDAPAHTRFAATKDLRSPDREFDRDANQANKWKNGARSGPGRDINDEAHRTPAGPHPINPRNKRDSQGHARRKSNALVGGIDLDEEIALARSNEIVPTGSRARQDQETDDEDGEYPEYDDDKLPPVPGVADAFSGIIDQELEKANQRAADGEYLLVDDDELVPTDPAARRKYLAEKKQALQAEYVLVKGDVKEEK